MFLITSMFRYLKKELSALVIQQVLPVNSFTITWIDPVEFKKQLIFSGLCKNAWHNFNNSECDAFLCRLIFIAMSKTSCSMKFTKLIEWSSSSPNVIRRLSISSWRCFNRAILIFFLTLSRIVVTPVDFSWFGSSNILASVWFSFIGKRINY